MIALHYFKYTFDLSDDVLSGRVENEGEDHPTQEDEHLYRGAKEGHSLPSRCQAVSR